MLSSDLVGDSMDVRQFVEGLKLFTLAESLGGVESLIAHPATMTHSCLSPDILRRAGISNTLLRVSVGLEAEEDLWDDLSQSFRALDAFGAAPNK